MYVKRNQAGVVIAVSHEVPQPGLDGPGWEPARGDEPGLADFGRMVLGRADPLSPSDLGLVRVLEDLIELLVDQSVIRFTDLPPAAQNKLLERKSARSELNRLSLLDDERDPLI